MKYMPLFTMRFLHEYFESGFWPTPALVPTPAGEKALRRLRARVRTRGHSLVVYVPTTLDDEPLIPMTEPSAIEWAWTNWPTDTGLYTDLSVWMGLRPVRLQNPRSSVDAAPTDADIELEAVQDTGMVAEEVVLPEQRAAAISLGGRPLPSAAAADFESDGPSVLNYDAEQNRINVDSRGFAPGTRFLVRYPQVRSQPAKARATVEIRGINARWLQGSVRNFRFAFQTRKAHWVYYLVTNGRPSDPVLKIVDPSDSRRRQFPEDRIRDLVAEPDATDPVAVSLAEAFPNRRRFRYLSAELFPCKETPGVRFQLQRGNERIFRALPLPTIDNASRLFISDAGSEIGLDTNYQIIHWVANAG